MKICLVRPSCGSKFQITPPLSLGYLSRALKDNGYEDIHMVDASAEDLDPSGAYEAVRAKGEMHIIGIQVYTDLHGWAKEFTNAAKRKGEKAAIVCGGPHISALKELALRYIGVDYGVIGEAEGSIVDFTRYIEGKISDPKDVEGLIFKRGGKYERAKKEYGFLEDPNTIPMPDWDILQPQRYFKFKESASLPLRGSRPADILTSRGCPYKCTFCSSRITARRIIRFRKPENIIEEIRLLKERFGVNEIFFSDDNLTMNLKRADRLFGLMIEKGLKTHWRAPNGLRVDKLEEGLVKKMAASGAYYVGLGVESGNKEVLKRIKKQLDLDLVPGAVKMLRKNGIHVNGFFMCGIRDETRQEINDSIKLALKTPFSRIQVSVYVPYPGSEDFDTIFHVEDTKFYEEHVMKFQEGEHIPRFHGFTVDEMYKIQREFLTRFYFRPGVIWSLLKEMRFSQMRALFINPDIRMWFKKEKKWYSSSGGER